MAHTPGEWRVGRGADAGKIIAEGNPPIWIAEVRYLASRYDIACLMAAAPDLLTACEAALEWLNVYNATEPYTKETEVPAQLRAAIAKARGREG